MPRRSSVGIAAPNPRPGQTAIGLLSQEDEADFLLMAALNELLTVEFGSPRYDQLTKIIELNRKVAGSAAFLGSIIDSAAQVVEEKTQLATEVETLEQKIESGDFVAHTNKFAMALKADVEANAVLDIRYLLYMQRYGPPVDGMFDPVLLAEFIDPQ